MKKIMGFLTLCLLLSMACAALADTIPLEPEAAYEYPRIYVMRKGDLLHVIAISDDYRYTFDDSKEGNAKYTNYDTIHAICYELRGDEFVPCESHCADMFCEELVIPGDEYIHRWTICGLAVSPQNETFVIDRKHNVYLWTPGEEEPWQYLCTLDTSEVPYENIAMEDYYVDGRVLYVSFSRMKENSTYVGEGTAFRYSLETGVGEKLCTWPILYQVYPAGNDKLLIMGNPGSGIYMELYLYDLTTKQHVSFGTKENLSDLISDGHGGWYAADFRGLFHIHGDGEAEMVTSLPSTDSYRIVSLSNDGQIAYIFNNNRLYRIPMDEESASKSVILKIAGNVNDFGWNEANVTDMAGFYDENPNIQVTSVDYPAAFDDVAMELLTGSDAFDLILLGYASGNVRSLIEKGFYVDLSGEEAIAAFLQEVYPVWHDPCMDGETIAALPAAVWNDWTFLYNTDIWEEEGLGDVPTTYDEFFDALIAWDEEGILDRHPLFYDGQYSFDSFYRLLFRIMVDSMGKCQQEGRAIDLHDEVLLHLLGRLEEVRPILAAHDARNVTGAAMFPAGVLTSVYHRSLNSFDPLSYCEPMPLGLTDAQDCVESAFYTVLVINPKSAHIDEAKAYLSYLAANPNPWVRSVLMQGMPDGVRTAGYEDATEKYERLIPELNRQILEADREGDDAMVAALEDQIRDITFNYQEKWEVPPRATEALYQVLPYFAVLTSDGYGFLEQNGEDLMHMYTIGQIDCETFLSRLDERMQMMRQEAR